MMRKTVLLALMTALCLTLILPQAALADLTNSDTIRHDMTAEQFASLALDTEGLNVELKAAGENEALYAELDATVIGINAEDVTYDLTVAEADGVTTITGYHRGKDFGVNSVKLTVYAPQDAIESLTLSMADSELTIDGPHIGSLDGQVTDGKVHSKEGTRLDSVSLNTNGTDISLKGEVGALMLSTTGGRIEMHSDVVPEHVTIDAADADVNLRVPETEEGFVVSYDILNGKFETNFSDQEYEERGTVTFGNGQATFQINMNGGELHVHKM